jgi:glutathione S-transferase
MACRRTRVLLELSKCSIMYIAGAESYITGKPYDWMETDVFKAETRSAEFLALNPNGKVPLLVFPDGRVLAESNAMLIHLAEGTPFLPSDSYQRALVYQWLFFEQYSHEPYFAVSRFLLHFDHGLEVSARRLAMLKERGEQALAVMEHELSNRQFMAGADFTIADIALFAYTHTAADGGFELGKWPSISRWISDVSRQDGIFELKDMLL